MPRRSTPKGLTNALSDARTLWLAMERGAAIRTLHGAGYTDAGVRHFLTHHIGMSLPDAVTLVDMLRPMPVGR